MRRLRDGRSPSSIRASASLPDGIALRAARPSDRPFARRLYFDGMRQGLTAIGTWNEHHVAARFRSSFRFVDSRIIRFGRADIGWIQISETTRGLHLQQLHLIERFRNNGIGTQLIQALQSRARGKGKPLALNVIRGNPAAILYRRLGFRTISKGDEKMHMRWEG